MTDAGEQVRFIDMPDLDHKVDGEAERLQAEVRTLRNALSSARAADARLTLALDSTGIGIWDWDIANDRLWMSPGAFSLHGYADGEMDSFKVAKSYFLNEEDHRSWGQELIACLKGERDHVQGEHEMRHKDGGTVWITERAQVVERGPDGRAVRMIGTRLDTTARRREEERLRWLALHDPLTGLANRSYFDELLSDAIREGDAQQQRAGLLFLDVDHFKRVNDTYGHDAGDMTLRTVASRLREEFKTPATVARIGGDEFGVLLRSVKSAEELADAAERAAGNKGGVCLSVGAAFCPRHGRTVRELRIAADKALYRAKEQGRGGAVVFDPRAFD